MSKSTSIKDLDEAENRKKDEITREKSKQDEETPNATKEDVQVCEEGFFSTEHVVLFAILLVVFHPIFNNYITSIVKFGGFTFVSRAILTMVILLTIKEVVKYPFVSILAQTPSS